MTTSTPIDQRWLIIMERSSQSMIFQISLRVNLSRAALLLSVMHRPGRDFDYAPFTRETHYLNFESFYMAFVPYLWVLIWGLRELAGRLSQICRAWLYRSIKTVSHKDSKHFMAEESAFEFRS